jgi:hypothetical protein
MTPLKRRLTERLRAAWDAFRDEPEPDGVAVHLTFWDRTPVIICDPEMSDERYEFVCQWMQASRAASGHGMGATKDVH